MLSETLGLNNYLLHLDYIDRQILLEQHDGDINKKIEEIINKNKEREEKEKETENELNADNTKNELQKDIKTAELALIEQVEGNDLQKPFNKFQ